ncbi:double-strand break repair protein AddB [Mesorhizobium sp. ZC-5]|uniref:double-strand break repair protein AddB n=1 Tax=Mesorhizobium sp. ZC-5 TaxID=2986066 RepID=UPI0021E7D21B|nr:double-strand break repair protein AddB [Mesorhizobium sp. ZC-5]MCV3239236.1 double-strand break repair protein AddB [Mesorhizobium sp. ZC-5]
MTGREPPKVFSIPAGAPFLPTLAEALISGALVPGFRLDRDPLKLATATIFVPTRRAARELRSVFVDLYGGRSAILPTIRALGEFDEDEVLFEPSGGAALDIAPPIASIDRLLLLAPLVRAWKRRLPAHVAALFEEEVVVPASVSDSIWLARDLAALMDEIETEGSDWSKLGELVSGDLASWWQVTLDFLEIVTAAWPVLLKERDRSNPALHRSALILAEAARLRRMPPAGPVIAAGSTGSVPATAELLSVIAQLPNGAVVLPGLDRHLDNGTWSVIAEAAPEPSVLGHPQFGLAKLLRKFGLRQIDVLEIGAASKPLARRSRLVSEALRPAETTDAWIASRAGFPEADIGDALSNVTLVEAANERDEALAIAIALRRAIAPGDKSAALVATDRNLARRVSAELLRFGIRADDSGGLPLARTAPATLLRLLLEVVFRPGDPVAILALLKHPLLGLGMDRTQVRRAAETIELITLRGGTGRPDVAELSETFERRLATVGVDRYAPFWLARMNTKRLEEARQLLARLREGLEPLSAFCGGGSVSLPEIVRATVVALENIGRGVAGDLVDLYAGDAGEKLAEFLRSVLASSASLDFTAREWPDILAALIATEVVKPAAGGDGRVFIWGALEARLQTVDTLVLGGLNEGSWPRRAEADRFMSRIMKAGIDLEPPERRIGLAAHDFWMAMGTETVVLTRAARSGDAPAVPSRWLQRLLTFVGKDHAGKLRARGDELLGWTRTLDRGAEAPFVKRPRPKPRLDARPKRFSVTEIETLRRDPYAVYARRILGVAPIEPLLRDPGAAERGTLFHEIMHRFTEKQADPASAEAASILLEIGRSCFAEAALPADVQAVWWPRFVALAGNIVQWERDRADGITVRHAEERAEPLAVGETGATLSGRADRIDLRPAGMADILDYKTGSSPSRGQAHTLLAPQLALEGALLKRGAFKAFGPRQPSQLAFVRFKANGEVEEQSILEHDRKSKSGPELADDAWRRLEQLLQHYNDLETGYLSRALPFREGDMDGDYDHLARVLEWSAGADDSEMEGGE